MSHHGASLCIKLESDPKLCSHALHLHCASNANVAQCQQARKVHMFTRGLVTDQVVNATFIRPDA